MPLTTDTKKVMFEIYRDSDFGGRFKVVYFTELGEHDKETEIENAMRGQHIFDGFLLHRDESVKLFSGGQTFDQIASQIYGANGDIVKSMQIDPVPAAVHRGQRDLPNRP